MAGGFFAVAPRKSDLRLPDYRAISFTGTQTRTLSP